MTFTHDEELSARGKKIWKISYNKAVWAFKSNLESINRFKKSGKKAHKVCRVQKNHRIASVWPSSHYSWAFLSLTSGKYHMKIRVEFLRIPFFLHAFFLFSLSSLLLIYEWGRRKRRKKSVQIPSVELFPAHRKVHPRLRFFATSALFLLDCV